MIQARVLIVDPRGGLKNLRESLTAPGFSIDVASRIEELLGLTGELHRDPIPLAVILDGDPESGLQPDLVQRFPSKEFKIPPFFLVVVNEGQRGRDWIARGATLFLERPFDPEDLRSQLNRWLNLGEQLRRSLHREETLRKFFAMYAHDLKNPLGAISGYCELAIEHPDLPPETREDLKRVCRNINLLNTMAFGLLEMVRGTDALQISPREVQLSTVVNEAVEMLRLRAEALGIQLRVKTAEPSSPIRIDPSRMVEALANVIDNAIRFSPRNSMIDISVSEESTGLSVTIDDEGPGISPDDRERVFESFTQASLHSSPGNLGLGLFIAKDIIERHRGTIRAEEHYPHGTRIAIQIPWQGPQSPIPENQAASDEVVRSDEEFPAGAEFPVVTKETEG